MPATPAPDMFLIMHHAMRGSARRMELALAELRRGDRGTLDALEGWFRGFSATVHHHHTVEDTIFFPALAGRDTAAAALVARMDADHHALDDAFTAVEVALAGLSACPPAHRGAWDGATATARSAAAALTAALADHLDREESLVVPRLGVFTAAEHAAMHERAMASGERRAMPFMVGWIAESLDDAERAALLAGTPAPLRLLYRLSWRRRYERSVEPLPPFPRAADVALAAAA